MIIYVYRIWINNSNFYICKMNITDNIIVSSSYLITQNWRIYDRTTFSIATKYYKSYYPFVNSTVFLRTFNSNTFYQNCRLFELQNPKKYNSEIEDTLIFKN